MISVRRRFLIPAIAAMVLGIAGCAQLDPYTPTVGQPGKDVVWVPTPQPLIDRMLDMAQLTPEDRLVDLGSGDGRLVITAAQRGASARGIEFNPDLVELSRREARAQGVANRVSFEQADIFESDFSDATVVTLFLLPTLNTRLRPILFDMQPGTRIVTNTFNLGDWQPDETAHLANGCTSYCRALMWVVPAKVAGTWEFDGRELDLEQNFQVLAGALREGALRHPITDARLDGTRVQFSIDGAQYLGEVDGDTMQGTIDGERPWRATRIRTS